MASAETCFLPNLSPSENTQKKLEVQQASTAGGVQSKKRVESSEAEEFRVKNAFKKAENFHLC